MTLQRLHKNPDAPTFWTNPFTEMERFFNGGFFSPKFATDRFFDRDHWLPAMDLKEEDGAYAATVELPGITKDDVKVTVEDNVVSVSGERKWGNEGDQDTEEEGKKKDGRIHRVERAYGKFERTLTLPRKVKADEVKAEFKDGVLHLNLPKAEGDRAHQVDIH